MRNNNILNKFSISLEVTVKKKKRIISGLDERQSTLTSQVQRPLMVSLS